MEFLLQILVGLASLMLTGLGTVSMFAPARMVKNFAIEPIGVAGLSTIRSVIGGFFLASVALLIIGLTTGQTLAFVAVAIFMGVTAFGRIVGLMLDGFDKAVIPPLLVELVIIAVLLTAYSHSAAIIV
ncbi:DUF4345 family protein [Pseudovibrio sp. Tun.PSC04-5.I4]|uniref:DUF4345 family protein n=1 Tax=Pseudovibrio sp. Tun.PSC04-5.I4 TaxID=1798213 RepID=UPI0008822467|nr:DUF4345 family protein [Pseudovibrio sp. Tun.PSC04-5.I4]SDR21137.1 protein of unknown function [Pseudovibrio sp. Tun.PSC04-5.I4]